MDELELAAEALLAVRDGARSIVDALQKNLALLEAARGLTRDFRMRDIGRRRKSWRDVRLGSRSNADRPPPQASTFCTNSASTIQTSASR